MQGNGIDIKNFFDESKQNKICLNVLKYQGQMALNQINEHQIQQNNIFIQTIRLQSRVSIQNLKGLISTQSLIIDFGEKCSDDIFINDELTNFKIINTLDINIYPQSKLTSTKSNIKCKSPICIKFRIKKLKNDWEIGVLDILNGLSNSENTKILHIYSSIYNPLNTTYLSQLYTKLEQFSNLRTLSLPFSCDSKAIQVLKETLIQLKSLVHLNVESFESDKIIQNVVHELTYFAIDQLKELRRFDIFVYRQIKMKKIKYIYRASPLNMTVMYVNTIGTLQIFEPRSGKWYQIFNSYDG